MDLPWRFGFAGGVARLAAIDHLVFPSGNAELAFRESCRSADRIFHLGDRAAVAGGGAYRFRIVAHFQQCELDARDGGDRIHSMVRAGSWKSLLRRRTWLAEKLPAKITVLDVGAGAAVHVRASRADWLLDCGSGRDYERVLRPYLHGAGINRITGLLLTHGDSLHLGGTENLLRDFVPDVLIDNSATDRSTVHRRIREIFPTHRLNLLTLKAGENFPISSDVSGRTLFPPADFTAATADDQAFSSALYQKDEDLVCVR